MWQRDNGGQLRRKPLRFESGSRSGGGFYGLRNGLRGRGRFTGTGEKQAHKTIVMESKKIEEIK